MANAFDVLKRKREGELFIDVPLSLIYLEFWHPEALINAIPFFRGWWGGGDTQC